MENTTQFQTGMSVIYGLHGKCSIKEIVTRQIDGQELSFYKLEVQRSPLARANIKQEPAIWVPVAQAEAKGLRLPVTATETDAIFALLSNREYYFPIKDSWVNLHPKFENSLRHEGLTGLAKVVSALFVMRRRQVVPNSEIVKFHDTTQRLLVKELAEALNELPRTIEERLEKIMRPKLLADH